MIKTDHIKRYVIELENIEERLNQDSFTKESTMFNYWVQRRDEIKDMVDKYLKMTQGASDNGKEKCPESPDPCGFLSCEHAHVDPTDDHKKQNNNLPCAPQGGDFFF